MPSACSLRNRRRPHFRLSIEVNIDKLLALRKEINANEPGVKVSVNDMVVKAVAKALLNAPDVNVQYDDEAEVMHRFADADIAIAVALETGLITPIVKAANKKDLATISTEIRDLATRAKAGTLQPSDTRAAVSRFRIWACTASRISTPIINPPQVGILGVGAGTQQPVVIDGEITVATIMTLSLAGDHRIIDGEPAARFLNDLRR